MARTRWVVPLLGLAVLGAAGSIHATSLGAGLIADSKYYLEAAQGLLHGHGLTVPVPDGTREPLTNWPPLFPLSLAVLGALGLDLHAAARWLNAVLLGGTVALGMLAVHRVTRGSLTATAFGGFLLATSIDLLTIFSQAASEPLFIFLALLGMILVAAHIEQPATARLLGAALAVGLAFLTRYPGAVLVAAGVIALLLFDGRDRRRRIRDAAVFTVVSTLPMVAWMIRNWRSARQPIGSFRVLVIHPVTRAQLRLGLNTVWGWIAPGTSPGGGPGRLLGHVPGLRWLLLAAAAVAVGLLTRRWRGWREHQDGEPLLAPPLLRLLATFVVLYLAFMVVSMSFFDATIPLDRRLLSPVLVAVVILAVGAGARVAGALERGTVTRGALALGCLLLVASYADAATRWVRETHANGLGYSSKTWQESETLRQVEALPADVVIYTNGDDVLSLVTDRQALELPRKVRLNTGQPNPTYEAELAAMADRLRSGAVLVYLRRVTWRTAVYGSETELKERLGLRPRETAADGSIYDVAP